MGDSIKQRCGERGFLGRLAHDVRGNTLAIMAAAMIPVLGFAGSAIDTARLYVVKVRLQQACDAGALAGRRTMTDTTTTTPLEPAAATQANAFFNNNFKAGWYQTTAIGFTPTKTKDTPSSTSANAVTGVATATVPMAVMQFFGMKPVKIDVTCEAHYDIADTDVMFVLDTTGSMSCTASDPASCANLPIVPYTRSDGTTGYSQTEKSDSKIEALRKAVILFDSTIRANADPTSHFRYGFVTYTAGVNVGKAIQDVSASPLQYLQNTKWTYQSRHVQGDYDFGSPTATPVLTGIPQATCVPQRIPATGYLRSYPGLWADAGYYQARRYSNLTWSAANGGTCSGTQQVLRVLWRYEPTELDTSAYVSGSPVVNPSRIDGSTSKWRGCIEELDSSPDATFDVNNLPDDLNPDVKPKKAKNKWRPTWPAAVWLRGTLGAQDIKDESIDETRTFNNTAQLQDHNFGPATALEQGGSAPCGKEAQQLKSMSAQEVRDFVYHPDFKPHGGTYHDVGMIWGTRMLSPDGIFGDDTAPWPGRNDPTRSIVFMTDGNMAPAETAYGQYGVEIFDNRVGSNQSQAAQIARHTARFRVECDAAKKKGITIYVVALGLNINNDLTYCASPGQTFEATSTDELTEAFAEIAKRVAMLRITK